MDKMNNGIYDFIVEGNLIRVVVKWKKGTDVPVEKRCGINIQITMYGNLETRKRILEIIEIKRKEKEEKENNEYFPIHRSYRDFYVFHHLLTNGFHFEFKTLPEDCNEPLFDSDSLKKLAKKVTILTHSRDCHQTVVSGIDYEKNGSCPIYISKATGTTDDDDINFEIDIETGRILNWNPELFYKYLEKDMNEKESDESDEYTTHAMRLRGIEKFKN